MAGPKRNHENAFAHLRRHRLERQQRDDREANDRINAFAAATTELQDTDRAGITLSQFDTLLATVDLLDRLPDLRTTVGVLAVSNEACYGFSFNPDEIRISPRALPRMLLGLWAGILIRPLVIDSPSSSDVAYLKLQGQMTLLEYRIRALATSGIGFSDMEFALPFWTQLRGFADRPLWTALLKDDGAVDASRKNLAKVYPTLPATPTIADRVDAVPRLLLIGPDDEPDRNRVLADNMDGHVRIEERDLGDRSVKGALEQRVRFLSPEAALLALGAGVRDGYTSSFASDSWVWVSGILPDGRVASLSTQDYGVHLGVADPTNRDVMIRLPASSE